MEQSSAFGGIATRALAVLRWYLEGASIYHVHRIRTRENISSIECDCERQDYQKQFLGTHVS